MRMLQHEFTNEKVIVKDKRFYIADKDNYPIAIFEYRDGTKSIKSKDMEDGLPLFLYKALLSSQSIKEDKIYRGNSNYNSDIILNIKDNKVYKNNSSYSSDIVYVFSNGKMYNSNSKYESDLIFTLKNNKVYKGNSSYDGSILFNISENISLTELVLIYHAYNSKM